MNLVKVSYVLTLLFVRNYCSKLNIKSAIESIEEDSKGSEKWQDFKLLGDILYKAEKYKEASDNYTGAIWSHAYSPELFILRAQTYIRLEKYRAAQLDAYIAVMLNPKLCEGYRTFSYTLIHQNLIKEAYNVANYGLKVCDTKESYYKTLQSYLSKIEVLLKRLSKKSENESVSSKSCSVNHHAVKIPPSQSETVPPSLDASDSDDESETTEKKTKILQSKNKTKKIRNPPEDSSDMESTQMDTTKITTYLKEASEAILLDSGYKAVQIFRGPLRDFIDTLKSNTIAECEVVCIKYAYGIAYYKSGEYDDLLKCITILKEIIEQHESVTFPAAYYALGLTYRKLNRFKEALSYLETVQNFLSKDIHFKVYPWPEIQTVIQETKQDVLKVLVNNLIKECENPSSPDAFCRYSDCSYQPTIYYSDPGFKGYISLFCSEQCCLQYHLQCWKIIKAEKQLADKEFLEELCLTPDCDGVVIKIQNINKKGNLAKEFISDLKKTGKHKWAKWEKKCDVKEKKKKKANSNSKSEDGSSEIPSENLKVSSRKNSYSNGRVSPPLVKDATSSENAVISLEEVQSSENSSILLKESLEFSSLKTNSYSSSVSSALKTKDISNISDKGSSNFQEVTYCDISEKEKEISRVIKTPDVSHVSEKDNECNSLIETTDSSHFQNGIEFSTEETEELSPQNVVSQCITNNIYSYMHDFLQHHGPLRIDDSLLVEELSSFPNDAITMITQCGGIGEFLKNDLRFAFVGDIYVCVVSDLAKAYRMSSNSSLQSNLASFQSLDSTDNSKCFNKCDTNDKYQNFELNPDAVEYTPVISALNDKNNDHKTHKNSLAKNLDYKSFLFTPELSSPSSSNTNTINESRKNNPESCDFVLESLLNKSSSCISERTEVGDNKGNSTFSDKSTCESKPSSKTIDLNSGVEVLNYNKNFIENNECTDTGGLSTSNADKGVDDNCRSTFEDSKLKKLQTELLPVLKEFCNENFTSFHQYINAVIKPYVIKKLPETVVTETETDFEYTAEDTNSTEQSKYVANSLKTENKQLEEENLLLKKQLASSSMEIDKLSEEVSQLKLDLNSSSFDLEVLKIDHKKKEEALHIKNEYLVKSLASAQSTVEEYKKHIELVESKNFRLKENFDELTLSLNDVEKEMKNAIKAEEKKHTDIIKNLQKENYDLKERLKYSEIQFLQTKKDEFLKRIEDKCSDLFMKKQELTRGLSMMSGSLNPMLQSSMKTMFSYFSNYENELKTLLQEFVKKMDAQIELVQKGTPLKELKDIPEFKIPDPPQLQSLFPEMDKSLLNSTQTGISMFNLPSCPQIPSASVNPKPTTSATNIPPIFIPPPMPSLKVTNPPSFCDVTPTSRTPATVIPSAIAPAPIIPQSTPSATIIPQAAPSSEIIPPSVSVVSNTPSINHSVLTPTISNLGANSKNIPDTCSRPPGIVKCTTSLLSSQRALNSSKDSLETFPVGGIYASSSSLTSKIKEPVTSTLEGEEKNMLPVNKGSSYEKLLMKLKEQFPSYTQDELISLVKNFRAQRKGKLTGLPMEAIITELRTIINSKLEAERKLREQKVQVKLSASKVLVNKKLVPDPKVPTRTAEQQSTKKKSAWGSMVSDCKKKFSGNPDDDCIICCDPMTSASAYKVACGHTFHEECIRQWLQNKSNCPVCRVLLLLPEEYPSLS